jgi:hypothetical protein
MVAAFATRFETGGVKVAKGSVNVTPVCEGVEGETVPLKEVVELDPTLMVSAEIEAFPFVLATVLEVELIWRAPVTLNEVLVFPPQVTLSPDAPKAIAVGWPGGGPPRLVLVDKRGAPVSEYW